MNRVYFAIYGTPPCNAAEQMSNVIGERVRVARLSQGLTLQALDERVQVQSGFELGHSTLNRIERGTRGVYDFEMVALSRALQVDARWLLGLLD